MSSDRSALLRRFVLLKELKAEYYVGSQDAFRYIKAISYYERLAEKIWAFEFVRYRLTLRQLIELHRIAARCLESHLNLLAANESTPQDLSLASSHKIVLPTMPEESDWARGAKDFHLWAIRSAVLMPLFLSGNLGSTEEMLAGAKKSMLEFFLAADDGVPLLVYEKTGEQVCLKDFREQPKFRAGGKEEFWAICYAENATIDNEEDCVLSSEEIADFHVAYQQSDRERCHQLLKKIKVADYANLLMRNMEPIVEEPCLLPVNDEEYLYLVDSRKLFERAGAEYALGQLDMERRITLSFLYGLEGGSPAQLLANAEKLIVRRLERDTNYLHEPWNARRQDEIRQNIRYHQYLKLALLQNKKWLLDFLNR